MTDPIETIRNALAAGTAPPAVAVKALQEAAIGVISSASDTYKKKNGHIGSFEDESGEKCWIVPFDAFEALRSALVSPADTSPVFTVAQIIEKIKDYGQDSLPTSEYRLACDDLVEAFEALAAAPKEASHDG